MGLCSMISPSSSSIRWRPSLELSPSWRGGGGEGGRRRGGGGNDEGWKGRWGGKERGEGGRREGEEGDFLEIAWLMNTHLLWTGESFITHSFAARFMRYFVSFLYLVDNIGSLWRGGG